MAAKSACSFHAAMQASSWVLSVRVSILLMASMIGSFFCLSWVSRACSSSRMAVRGSVTSRPTSTPDTASPMERTIKSPSRVRGLWLPGVSRNTSCILSLVTTPMMRVRVV